MSTKPELPRPPKHNAPFGDPTNDDRAIWAAKALQEFQRQTRCDNGDALCDLLADLMHAADRTGQDFDGELNRARMHYQDEKKPNEGFPMTPKRKAVK